MARDSGSLNGAVGVRISGVGVEIPPRVVTSAEIEEWADLEKRFGFDPGWLERVTGVRERRWAAPDVRPSELAVAASRKALADAQLQPEEIDVVIFGGISKDFLEPAVSNVVANELGASNARVFDLMNACNGPVDGIDVADLLIRSGKARHVLIATGERLSDMISWQADTADEFRTLVAGLTLGDGGGAMVLQATEDQARGILDSEYSSNPAGWPAAVGMRVHGTRNGGDEPDASVDFRFVSEGKHLFGSVFEILRPTIETLMERVPWEYHDIDVVLLHEATKRFADIGIRVFRDRIASHTRVWSTVERFGNTSTFSLPLALTEARDEEVLVPGSKVVIALVPLERAPRPLRWSGN